MTIWLTKLLLAHLLTDFLLQRKSWIDERRKLHFASPNLYVHTLFTAAVAWLFIGWDYWLVAFIIFITHTLIDGWKSYKPDIPRYFLTDQALHLAVILGCWWFSFYDFTDLKANWLLIATDTTLWIKITAYTFITWPCAYLIGQLTQKWRVNLLNSDGLADAGKWIGIIERLMILTLVLHGQFEAVGLLIAAKSIIRFSETNRTEQKTEYLLIGTLLSMGLAIGIGLIVNGIAELS